MNQNTIEDSFIVILSEIIFAIEKIDKILLHVLESGKTYETNEILSVYDKLFLEGELKKHIFFSVALVGKSTQANYLVERTLENSNRHIALELSSEAIKFYNNLYDNKFSDLLKFFKHTFSLIENFSIYSNTKKVEKFKSLLSLIKADFEYFKKLQDEALKHKLTKSDLLKAFSFLAPTTEKKANWQEYLSIIIYNDIQFLYHFTDKENLASIKENGGLYSWHYCEKNKIEIPKPGSNEFSRQLDKNKGLENFVRLSFVENHPMKFIAVKEQRIINPIILKCDTDLIMHKNTLFSNCNAAKNESIVSETIDFFKSLKFGIFKQNYFSINNDPALKSAYQSEVLIPKFLPSRYILNLNSI